MKTKLCNLCKKTKRYANLSFCYSCYRTREKEKREAKELKKKEGKVKTKKYQQSEIKKLERKAWQLFSLYIRKKGADFQGYAKCYTCGIRKPYTKLHAGHLFHKGRGRYMALDFDERHIHIQCAGCNTYKAGMGPEFTLKLISEYGIDLVEEMKERRHTEPPLTNEQLQEIINKYKEK